MKHFLYLQFSQSQSFAAQKVSFCEGCAVLDSETIGSACT